MQPDNDQQEFYATSKLINCTKVIATAINDLPELRSKVDAYMNKKKAKAKGFYEDILKIHAKLIETLLEASLLLGEMDENNLAEYSVKLSQSVKAFNPLTPDYSKLCGVLERYIQSLPTVNETTNAEVFGRLMNNIKIGYYPTDLEHIQYLTTSIAFPENITTNLLDPCCGKGIALRAMADGNNCFGSPQRNADAEGGFCASSAKVMTYGVEIDEFRAEEAQTRLHRVGIGSFYHSQIQHEAFHVILLNPPYLRVLSQNGGNFRSEKRFLVESVCHLMMGGLMIYIIPYYRLTEDICKVFSDNFSDITVWRFKSKEFKKFKQVVVMGLRKKKSEDIEQAVRLSAMAFDHQSIPEISALPEGRYSLPAKSMKVDLFKGAQFNVMELADQLKNSSSLKNLLKKNEMDNRNKRPLLPLSIGQVGLIGGSGYINGLIEAEDPYIIKGRVIKVKSTRNEPSANGKSVEIHETISNKMIFNLLTKDGFISLS